MRSLKCISECQRCAHREHQAPLLDIANAGRADVFWLGLSAKVKTSIFERPLDDSTHSGKLIALVEAANSGFRFYRSNALKCPPFDGTKLRYPSADELETCWPNTLLELSLVRPKCVLVLGSIVAAHLTRMTDVVLTPPTSDFDVTFVYARKLSAFVAWLPHPSYLQTYKRRRIGEFCTAFSESLTQILARATRGRP